MNSLICEGINKKCKIQFYYEDGMRIVEPFCYGLNNKGNEVLRAYQTGGYSKSGNPCGWRIYNIAKVSSITILNDRFDGNRPEYNPDDKQMLRVFCNI